VTEAGSQVGGRRLLRAVAAAVSAFTAGALAWWLLGRGVATDDFPAFLDSQSVTPITRYSGPWLTAAAGAALLAALLVLAAVFDLVRWSRARTVRGAARSSATSDSAEFATGGLTPGGLSSSALSSAQ
jgi:hypothetical protein